MVDNRKHARCTLRWRCALVVNYKGFEERTQCRTLDVSVAGLSVICHFNISPPNPVTVYLLVEPAHGSHEAVVVEAQGRVSNNVLSGQQGGFRLGIEFTKFAGDGKQVLIKHLPSEGAQSPRAVAAAGPPPNPIMTAPPKMLQPDTTPAPDMAEHTTNPASATHEENSPTGEVATPNPSPDKT
jgi:hypothetical protein